jgi:hypothetical protein
VIMWMKGERKVGKEGYKGIRAKHASFNRYHIFIFPLRCTVPVCPHPTHFGVLLGNGHWPVTGNPPRGLNIIIL